jgi:simple sugar transport system ATP-binding protein
LGNVHGSNLDGGSDVIDRIVGAPISWGVCEVPGWGIQLTVDRVLGEMRGLGLRATELGAIGWLPTDPTALSAVLGAHDLRLAGAFVPLVCHDPARRQDTIDSATATALMLEAVDAEYFVTAVVSDLAAWQRVPLTEAEWDHLVGMLDEIERITEAHGLRQVVHPHVDTLIETAAELDRIVDASTIAICLDTGHITIGGGDPLDLARNATERVGLVHLKDVRIDVASRLNAGELTLMSGVQDGLFAPLGDGSVPIAEIVTTLEHNGYKGRYVLEQDVAITDGEPAAGEGPARDVARSVAYLRSVQSSLSPSHGATDVGDVSQQSPTGPTGSAAALPVDDRDTALLEVRNLGKNYGHVIALEGITTTVRAGQVTCVLGDNGAGKSTFIKILSGVHQPSEGDVLVDGEVVSFASPRDALEQGIATVYQDLAVVPLMSVWRNFWLGDEPRRRFGPFRWIDTVEAKRVAREELFNLGIDIRDLEQPVGTLSGGERQSVAIARAAHRGARVLILDEPTSALGVKQSGVVLRYVVEAARRNLGVIFITHNPHHAWPVGDRFLILNRGHSLGNFAKHEIDQEALTGLMAGGAELRELQHELAGAGARPTGR